MRDWDVLSLVGLAQLSPLGLTLATAALQQTWIAELGVVTDDVDAFLQIMRSTGACLSGGRCLSILDRTSTWQSNDWDFYCPREGFNAFCLFIIDRLHGVAIDYKNGPPEGYHARSTVVEYRRISTPTAVIDIICSASCSALLPLTSFHSTLVMNVMSADMICIPYPWCLDARRGIVQSAPIDLKTTLAIDKYKTRGYDFCSVSQVWPNAQTDSCAPYGHCARAVRHYGDENCLTIRFAAGPSQMRLGGMLWSAAWIWGGHQCGNLECVLQVEHYAHTILVGSSALVL